jgi:drug/metabolite transporter (DMT)-like permease
MDKAGKPGVWLWAVLAALGSALFFGLNAVASKILYAPGAPAHFDAVSLFVARGVWSLPLFLGLAFFTRPRPLPRVSRLDAALFLICGLAYGPGTNALSALGASRTSAAHAVMLLSLFPPLAGVLAAILLRERLAPIRIVAIAVGVIGAVVLALSKSSGGATLAGDALIGGFIFAWALVVLIVRKLDRTYPPLFVAGVFGTLGAVMLAAMGAGLGRLDAVLIPLRHFDLQTVLWFDLELVLLLSLAGQLLQALALRGLPVSLVVALTSYGTIFFGLAASLLLLGEHLGPADIAAGLVLVTALGLSLAPERLRKA